MNDKNIQDQKKRTLEALERRFALADADLQQKNNKRPREERGRVNNNSLSSSTHQAEVWSPPPSSTSSKKGKLSLSDQTPVREANDPVYTPLLHQIDENLTVTCEASSKRGSIADWIFNDLRQKGDSSQKMQGFRNMKRDEWILLDNLVQGKGMSGATQAKALRSLSKRSKKHMSKKQLKKCGSMDLPQELHNFEIFKPMHDMWKDYIKQLLKNVGKNELAKCLLSADLHGAVILVAECKIASYTGVNGIMIRETAETFGIITKDNKFKGCNIRQMQERIFLASQFPPCSCAKKAFRLHAPSWFLEDYTAWRQAHFKKYRPMTWSVLIEKWFPQAEQLFSCYNLPKFVGNCSPFHGRRTSSR